MKTLDELGVYDAPWQLEDNGKGSYLIFDNLPPPKQHCICGGPKSDIATGRLMSAAPELYRALTILVSFAKNPLISEDDMFAALKMAQKAIEKAGGGK